MKKKNLLFFPFLWVMGIVLFSCNVGNGKRSGNSQTFQNTLAVVINSDLITGETAVGTPYGYLAAPSLTDVSTGDCIIMYNFTIDFDHQPTSNYFTISNVDKDFVSQGSLLPDDTTAIDESTIPISDVTAIVNDPSNAYYQGKIFLGITCKDKNPDFRLIYDDSKDKDINSRKTVYLQAKASSSTPSSSDVGTVYAFDMNSLSRRDTTISISGTSVPLKYVAVNLKYLSDITDDGEPVYTAANSPLYIYSFQ